MIQILFPQLLGYAACGLVLSAAVHLGSLAGFQAPGGNVLFGGLSFGIFPLVLALIAISRILPGSTDVKTDNWKLPVFPECPAWMNYMARGLYIYAVMIFATSFLMGLFSTGSHALSMSHSFEEGDPSIATWRGFSSVWMVFYSSGLASLMSARRQMDRAERRGQS